MLERNDKLYAAVAIVFLALVTVLSPFDDLIRLWIMLTLLAAAAAAERVL